MRRITFYSTIAFLFVISFFVIIFTGKHCTTCFSPAAMALKLFISGLIIMFGSFYFKRIFLETEKVIFDIESEPVIHTDEATDGVPFAGEGIIENEEGQALRSPYTDTPCVYYHSVTEKLVKSGKNSHWVLVENVAKFAIFNLKDIKGRLKINLANMDDDFSLYHIPLPEKNPNPENSEIDCRTLLKNYNYIENKPGFLGFSVSTKYRRSEYVLEPDAKVFVYGIVKNKDGQLVLQEDERCPLVISRKSHDEYINDFYRGVSLVYLSPVLMAIGYTVSLFSASYLFQWNALIFWLLFLSGNVIIAGSFFSSLYNRIITFKTRALNAESNIDVELARRSLLIPQLAETVKGYARHESEIQRIIAESRMEKIFSKELIKKTTAVIPSLAMTIENYPDLKAVANFQALMETLVDTENRISYSRQFYNRNIMGYNSLISRFPYILVSSFLNMKELEYLSIAHQENSAPQILI